MTAISAAHKITSALDNEARHSGCGRSEIVHGVHAELVMNGRAVIWYQHETRVWGTKISYQEALTRVAASIAAEGKTE